MSLSKFPPLPKVEHLLCLTSPDKDSRKRTVAHASPGSLFLDDIRGVLSFAPSAYALKSAIDGDDDGEDRLLVHNMYTSSSGSLGSICNGLLVTGGEQRISLLYRTGNEPVSSIKDILLPRTNLYFQSGIQFNRVHHLKVGDVVLVDCNNFPMHTVSGYNPATQQMNLPGGYQIVICLPAIADMARFEHDVLGNTLVLREIVDFFCGLVHCWDNVWTVNANGVGGQNELIWDQARGDAFYAMSFPTVQALEDFDQLVGEGEESEDLTVADRVVHRRKMAKGGR